MGLDTAWQSSFPVEQLPEMSYHLPHVYLQVSFEPVHELTFLHSVLVAPEKLAVDSWGVFTTLHVSEAEQDPEILYQEPYLYPLFLQVL